MDEGNLAKHVKHKALNLMSDFTFWDRMPPGYGLSRSHVVTVSVYAVTFGLDMGCCSVVTPMRLPRLH